jgi:hypothetical protein
MFRRKEPMENVEDREIVTEKALVISLDGVQLVGYSPNEIKKLQPMVSSLVRDLKKNERFIRQENESRIGFSVDS